MLKVEVLRVDFDLHPELCEPLAFLVEIFFLPLPCPIESAVADELSDGMKFAAVEERPVATAYINHRP